MLDQQATHDFHYEFKLARTISIWQSLSGMMQELLPNSFSTRLPNPARRNLQIFSYRHLRWSIPLSPAIRWSLSNLAADEE